MSENLLPPYKYLKAHPKPTKVRSKSRKRLFRLIPPVMITLGSILIANVVWPILSHELFMSPNIRRAEFVSPVAVESLGSGRVARFEELKTNENVPQVLGAEVDYTNPRNWFPSAKFESVDNPVKFYTIDIPSLEIYNANVEVGGEDLDKSLIHFPGTAKPGQLGAPVIFGHSTLRRFYNPSEDNPRRYYSIFATIMTMKKGDKIYVNYDGIKYTYTVSDIVEVQPEDTFILEQRYNNRTLKLITCTPEGTYLRRGVIIAQLVDLEQPSRNRN